MTLKGHSQLYQVDINISIIEHYEVFNCNEDIIQLVYKNVKGE